MNNTENANIQDPEKEEDSEEELYDSSKMYAWEKKYGGIDIENDIIHANEHQFDDEEVKDKWYVRRQFDKPVKRSIIRNLIIVLDLSADSLETDYLPNRLVTIQNALPKFLSHFFELNPLSMVSIIGTKNRKTFEISSMSHDIEPHLQAIQTLEPIGQQSLQSCLELALMSFSVIPQTVKKEVLCFLSSTCTCDPGDIFNTLSKLENQNITTSILSFGGEVHLYKEIAKRTHGLFKVPQNFGDLINILNSICFPPPLIREQKVQEVLIPMGFPKTSGSGVCDCHLQQRTELFKCPHCSSRVCAIPSTCPVCNLLLVDSLHISKSRNYLFLIKNFVRLEELGVDIPPQDELTCTGCLFKTPIKNIRFCPDCRRPYCNSCNEFIHESLFNCPTCLH